jgi:hypothetical protein
MGFGAAMHARRELRNCDKANTKIRVMNAILILICQPACMRVRSSVSRIVPCVAPGPNFSILVLRASIQKTCPCSDAVTSRLWGSQPITRPQAPPGATHGTLPPPNYL